MAARGRMAGPLPIETMRVFITGVGGFWGSHLAEFLLEKNVAICGTTHREARNVEHLKDRLVLLPCDILDRGRVETVVQEAHPEVIFHMAAQSLPLLSWHDPEATFRVNVFGTLYLLEAVRKAGLSPTIVVACSSAEYGFAAPEELPIREEKALQPASPYGVSKAAADLLCRVYWTAHRLKVIRVRPFFVVGPRKTGDVCSDFAKGTVAVERGQQVFLKVGNLEAVRDFLDVRDAARAMWILAEKGSPGEVYNLCTGRGYKVREILDLLGALTEKPIPMREEPQGLRLVDEPVIIGDNSKLRALGWEPQIPFERTVADILDYWRGIPE